MAVKIFSSFQQKEGKNVFNFKNVSVKGLKLNFRKLIIAAIDCIRNKQTCLE
jgi:hypothetical protein